MDPPFSRSLYFSVIEVDMAEELEFLVPGVEISGVIGWFEFIELVFIGLSIRSELSL